MCAHSVVKSIHEGITGEPRCLAALGDILKVPSLAEERAFRAARARDEDVERGGSSPRRAAPTSATAGKSTPTRWRPAVRSPSRRRSMQ
eukprot:6989494-Prymnesium_polylepis.1